MYELLKECEDNKILTAVYPNRSTYNSFSVGYVMAATEEEILLARIGPRGEFDGYGVYRCETIFRVETKGAYLRRVELLWKLKGGVVPDDIPFIDEPLMDLLQYAADNHLISAFCLDEEASTFNGYVSFDEQERICVRQLDELGREDGKTWFYAEEITRMVILDTEGIDLDMLHRFHKENRM